MHAKILEKFVKSKHRNNIKYLKDGYIKALCKKLADLLINLLRIQVDEWMQVKLKQNQTSEILLCKILAMHTFQLPLIFLICKKNK